MAGLFVSQSDTLMQTLAARRTLAGDKSWSEAAHALKGNAAGIGAGTLAALYSKAQNFSGSLAEQAALFTEIESEYARVKDCLKSKGLLP